VHDARGEECIVSIFTETSSSCAVIAAVIAYRRKKNKEEFEFCRSIRIESVQCWRMACLRSGRIYSMFVSKLKLRLANSIQIGYDNARNRYSFPITVLRFAFSTVFAV
jgi:hypothetical protein